MQPGPALARSIFQGLRPVLPASTPESYRKLAEACWSRNIAERPSMQEIVQWLQVGWLTSDDTACSNNNVFGENGSVSPQKTLGCVWWKNAYFMHDAAHLAIHCSADPSLILTFALLLLLLLLLFAACRTTWVWPADRDTKQAQPPDPKTQWLNPEFQSNT
jgi:hypothetical protein